MRRAVLVWLLLVSARAFAQPAPPPPPPPTPAPPEAPPVPGQSPAPAPEPDHPASRTQDPTATPEPPHPPPTVHTPPSVELTPTEKRLNAERLCGAHSPDCDWTGTFGTLERQSIARALAARGYVIDPQPWGKQIAKVRVYNEDVFAEDNFFQALNFIHFTTREQAIRDELTIGAGDVWDDDKVAESTRRLHDPLYTSVVALLPVTSAEPGKVDLLVVTRDVWSLRFNTQYTFQEGSLTNLSFSISENNFLGHRDVVAATMVMDQGSLSLGPLFTDKNLLGKHLTLSASAGTIMTRQSLDIVTILPDQIVQRTPSGDPKGLEDGGGYRREGSYASVSMGLPLWSLASEWAWGAAFSYRNSIARSYLGTGIRSYDDPRTPEVEMLAREYRSLTWSAGASGSRQWGSKVKQSFSVGYSLSSSDPTLLPNTTTDPTLAADFVRDVFPHNEVISQPYVEYKLFTPRYRTLRNYRTYEFPDDVSIGPSLDVAYYQSLAALGSTHTFGRPTVSVGWTIPIGDDGFVTPSAGGSLRIQPNGDGVHDTIDNSAQVSIYTATPMLGFGRIVAQAELDTLWHNTQNTFYTIGSDGGLRGYGINAFAGQRRFSGQIEVRSRPYATWVFRTGVVGFYEAGGAANSLDEMTIYHDVGVGIRELIPQTSRELLRFDVAMPLRAAPGWPMKPHFIAGFQSYF